jgi:hypothetical protein
LQGGAVHVSWVTQLKFDLGGLFFIVLSLLFCRKPMLPIDARCFSWYNAPTETQKEASAMGEGQNLSVGLLAHV